MSVLPGALLLVLRTLTAGGRAVTGVRRLLLFPRRRWRGCGPGCHRGVTAGHRALRAGHRHLMMMIIHGREQLSPADAHAHSWSGGELDLELDLQTETITRLVISSFFNVSRPVCASTPYRMHQRNQCI